MYCIAFLLHYTLRYTVTLDQIVVHTEFCHSLHYETSYPVVYRVGTPSHDSLLEETLFLDLSSV